MPTIDEAVAALKAGKNLSTFTTNRLTAIETVYVHGVKEYEVIETVAEPAVKFKTLYKARTPEAAVAALLVATGMSSVSIRIKD